MDFWYFDIIISHLYILLGGFIEDFYRGFGFALGVMLFLFGVSGRPFGFVHVICLRLLVTENLMVFFSLIQ